MNRRNSGASQAFPTFFPETNWRCLRELTEENGKVRARAWEGFFGVYFPCLVAALRRRGVDGPQSEDIVQETFVRISHSGDVLQNLAPERGRLRTYLLNAAINNYRESLRRAGRIKRGGGMPEVVLDEALAAGGRGSEEASGFDRDWAVQTARLALDLLGREYAGRDQQELFEKGIPLLDRRDPEARESLAGQLDYTANALTVALKRLRERLAWRLREVVAATLHEPEAVEVDEELAYLMKALPAGLDLETLVNHSPTKEAAS